MPAAAAVRLQIERALEYRFPAALTPAPRAAKDVARTGIAEVDDLLDGGLPVGAISEVTGPESSGRTSLALAFLARRTDEGQVCAWVDTSDAFDPESAAANGVGLRQLLWVRCGGVAMPRGGGAVAKSGTGVGPDKPWARLDQALRATDLLLQGGGFAAIVLDLGSTAPEYAGRIPLATWFRYRQAADRTRCSLVVVGKAACAQSSAAVALECARLESACGAETAGGTVMRGFTFKVQRSRVQSPAFAAGMRKPPASTWSAGTAWSAGRRV